MPSTRGHVVRVLSVVAILALAAVSRTASQNRVITFPTPGRYLISLPGTITTPTITNADQLLEVIDGAVRVAKHLPISDKFLVWNGSQCTVCNSLDFLTCDPPQPGPVCFSIDPTDGLAYFVDVAVPGSLAMEGSHYEALIIELLKAGPGSASGTNYISMPFEAWSTTADDLYQELDRQNVIAIKDWNCASCSFQSHSVSTPNNFPLVRGEGSVVTMSQAMAFSPATLPDPGPINSTLPGCGMPVQLSAGVEDACGGATEAANPSVGLVDCCDAGARTRDFDESGSGRKLLHSFNLSAVNGCIQSAVLRFRAQPAGNGSANDTLELSVREINPPGRALPPSDPTAWVEQLGDLAGASWTDENFPACDTDFEVPIPASVLRGMRSLRRLDVAIGLDTEIDHLVLEVMTYCSCCGDVAISPVAGEVCDGSLLNGQTCASQGVPGSGTLYCDLDCRGYDTSFCATCAPGNDADADGACNAVDNCPGVSNPGQGDGDGDGVGDACDPCAEDPGACPCLDADDDGWAICQGGCVPLSGNDCGDCGPNDPTVNPDASEVCDAVDNDCDASTNEMLDDDGDGLSACQGDCAPADATAFAVPAEIADLVYQSDKTTLTWAPAAPGAGSGTVHDVVRGAVSELPVGSGSSEVCAAEGEIAATALDTTLPESGAAFWYLVRGRNACGTGTYGFDTSGAELVSDACP